jgi:beta-1,4-mannosyl-glycoprotein beta-1,4-N-acetylglucosaminyltransferase
MAEWLKALAWKACILLKVSRVRIPFSPPNEIKSMKKIYDCVTYFNENLQLELRFNILNEHVHKFIVCEAMQDHKGRKKKINFNIKNFHYLKNKIIHIVCEDFPKGLNPWERQALQREFILKGLDEAKDEDYVIFSDPDEIPNPKKLINIKLKKKYGIFMQKSFCYKINLLNKYESPWAGSRIVKKKNLKSIDWLRQKVLVKNLKYSWFRFDKEKNIELINDGGWHFNNLMKPERISLKLKTFAHTEYESNKFSDVNIIKDKILKREDLFNRNFTYNKIYLDKSFPRYIIKNKKKYKEWII